MKYNFLRKALLPSCVSGIFLAMPALANDTTQSDRSHDWQKNAPNWEKMQEKTISAQSLLGANVHNRFSLMGSVRDLVLAPDRSEIESILYEVPYPYSFYSEEDGYVAFENVKFEHGGSYGMTARIDSQASRNKSDTLKLTRGEADHRLISRIINESISFSSERNTDREIEDLLLDRNTGKITHYVIELNENAIFSEEPRAIPADKVTVNGQGIVSTSLSFKDIEKMQDYSPDFL